MYVCANISVMLLYLDNHHRHITLHSTGDKVEIKSGSNFRKPSQHKQRFEILYEDDEMFVVGKPVDMLVSKSKELLEKDVRIRYYRCLYVYTYPNCSMLLLFY